jgi:HAD superfamily hydrolase (TIGR01509 family)
VTAPFPFRTVLLDVDGTLIDSNGAHADAWARALREHGFPVGIDQIRALIGMGGDKLLPAAAQIDEDSEPGKAIGKRKKALFAEMLPSLRPTPGARPLIEYLKHHGVGLVVATSAGEEEMDALLRQAGVDDLIPRRTSKDDAAESKPDPDIVRAALAQVRARPDESVLVGDTPYDIEAAARAGVPAIVLRCGGHWTDADLSGAIEIADDPAALLDHWRGPRVRLSTIVT